MKTKPIKERLCNNHNKLARFYDNGGVDAGGSIDRYTAVYLVPNGSKDGLRKWYDYRAMSSHPFHPQGIGLYCESGSSPLDAGRNGVPSLGRKNHLGKRIRFQDLPEDCQNLVIQDLTPEHH